MAHFMIENDCLSSLGVVHVVNFWIPTNGQEGYGRWTCSDTAVRRTFWYPGFANKLHIHFQTIVFLEMRNILWFNTKTYIWEPNSFDKDSAESARSRFIFPNVTHFLWPVQCFIVYWNFSWLSHFDKARDSELQKIFAHKIDSSSKPKAHWKISFQNSIMNE